MRWKIMAAALANNKDLPVQLVPIIMFRRYKHLLRLTQMVLTWIMVLDCVFPFMLFALGISLCCKLHFIVLQVETFWSSDHLNGQGKKLVVWNIKYALSGLNVKSNIDIAFTGGFWISTCCVMIMYTTYAALRLWTQRRREWVGNRERPRPVEHREPVIRCGLSFLRLTFNIALDVGFISQPCGGVVLWISQVYEECRH